MHDDHDHACDAMAPPNDVTGLTVTYHAMLVAMGGWVAVGGQLILKDAFVLVVGTLSDFGTYASPPHQDCVVLVAACGYMCDRSFANRAASASAPSS